MQAAVAEAEKRAIIASYKHAAEVKESQAEVAEAEQRATIASDKHAVEVQALQAEVERVQAEGGHRANTISEHREVESGSLHA